MAFYQGSPGGLRPRTSSSTASISAAQVQFESTFFPKCVCFKSKMSDISETNNPRCCSLISTESHLKDSTKQAAAAALPHLTRSTRMLCVTRRQSCLNVTQLRRLFIVFFFQTGPVVKLHDATTTKKKVKTVESRNYIQQRSGASMKRF